MATLQQAIDNLVAATATANDVINQAKTVNTATTAHKADPNAHKELFAKPAADVDLGGGNTAKGQGQIGRCVRTAAVTDADQYVTDGRYFIFNIDAVSNWPVEGSGGVLRVDSYSTYVMQEMRLLNGRVYVRAKQTGSAWSEWVQQTVQGQSGLDTVYRVTVTRNQQDYHPYLLFTNENLAQAPTVQTTCCAINMAIGQFTGTMGSLVGSIVTTVKPDFSSFMNLRCASAPGVTHTPCVIAPEGVLPGASNAFDLGSSARTYKNAYLANAPTIGSDRRLKTDIKDTPLGLDFIKALHPVAYKLIVGDQTVTMERETDENGEPLFVDVQDGTEQVRTGTDENGEPIMEERPIMRREPKLREVVATRPGARTHYGLIAQEVRETLDSVAPGVDFAGWVLEDKNDPDSQQSLRYEQFIAPLIRAVQEQQAHIEALRAEVDALKVGA